MGIINPYNPVTNALIFYVIFVLILLIVKPKFLYSDKNKKFKQFGCRKDQTLLSFPVIAIIAGIFFYMIFSSLEVVCMKLEYYPKKSYRMK